MEPRLKVNPKEEGPLQELTALALQVTHEEQYLMPDNFLRVLRARELKVQAAFELWKKWYDWRREYRADCITEEEMLPQIATGKIFIHGRDKLGRPCLIVRTRYHWPEQFPIEDMMRLVIFHVEKIVKIADDIGIGQISVLWDRAGMTEANRDHKWVALMRTLTGMLQDFYAERLGAVYVLHVNWVYWLMFQIAKPLIQRKTGDKIKIIRNTAGLKEHFDPDQLLREYGGESDYIHPYPEP